MWKKNVNLKFWFSLFIIGLFLPLHADIIKDQDAVRAIIGEAANQGYTGMLAVASAIHNRKTLKGVYGFKSSMPDTQPTYVWTMAKKAWKEGQINDKTNGATNWVNEKEIGKPWWAKDMIQTVTIKDHVFYRKKP
jgi:hypothetical protein